MVVLGELDFNENGFAYMTTSTGVRIKISEEFQGKDLFSKQPGRVFFMRKQGEDKYKIYYVNIADQSFDKRIYPVKFEYGKKNLVYMTCESSSRTERSNLSDVVGYVYGFIKGKA